MRLVEGTNLAELIQTRGVTADQTIELLRPIASALDTAHAAGLIHRDVKPQNILITSQGHPYLADFGVAKGSNTYGLTATGGFVGSVNYASPEQIKGLTLTPASDVYALTAVLYQCLTGHVPFPRETDAGVMHAHLHDPPPTLPTLTGADSDFHTVLARGMAKDPGARYGHAGDLMNGAALSVSRLPIDMRKSVPAFPAQESAAPQTPSPDPTSSNGTEILAPRDLAEIRASSEFTAADRRRPPTPAPTAPNPRKTRPRGLIWGGVAALVAALVIVAVVATGGSSNAHASTVQAGHLVLSANSGWHRATVSISGLSVEDPVGLLSGNVSVAAGQISTPNGVPASVPSGLATAYGSPSHSAVVSLPLGQVRSYNWPLRSHGALAMVIVATEHGESAIACATGTATAVAAMEAACATLAGAAKITGDKVEYPGADPKVAEALSAALGARAGAVTAAAPSAHSARLASRGPALTTLAATEAAAARRVAGIAAPPSAAAAVGRLGKALAGEASLTASLAHAALRSDAALYDSLRGQLLSASLARNGSELASIGFSGLPLPSPPLPRAPATLHHRHVATTPRTTSPAPVVAVTPPATASPTPVETRPEPSPPPASTPSRPKEKEEVIISKPE